MTDFQYVTSIGSEPASDQFLKAKRDFTGSVNFHERIFVRDCMKTARFKNGRTQKNETGQGNDPNGPECTVVETFY
jgi:hypothetical protein